MNRIYNIGGIKQMTTDKRKYKYIYEVRTNNLCYGNILLGTYNKFRDAHIALYHFSDAYGCCAIIRVRKHINV